MRRADRLFAILQILRRKKMARAADIAAALDVSPRTIYRDIRDLMAHGVDRSKTARDFLAQDAARKNGPAAR